MAAMRRNTVDRAKGDAKRIRVEAEAEAANRVKSAEVEAKEKLLEREREFERDLHRRRREMERIEAKLQKRESLLEKKIDSAERHERSMMEKDKRLEEKLAEAEAKAEQYEKLRAEALRKCEELSGLTVDQAKDMLLRSLEEDIKQEAAALIRRVETETKENANKKARQIITLAIQKCATDQVSESTVSVVNLPNDEMKGRIIGREGRNIRALEAATGVNIIIDDTPEAVVLSCFDPMRREIARQTLEKLLGDGRIHPGRIEEVVAKVEKEVNDNIRETGERTAFDLGIHGMHPELLKLLGRLKYRTSYGQNVLMHTQEVVHLMETMASELGVDAQLAKRAGLLHDIGKAVSYEMEGTHAMIGAELARKYNEPPAVVHAMASHHWEEEPKTIIAVLLQAADAISAARPGARRETLESYVKRLENLERIANSYEGVDKAYALQAGREIRIAVEPTAMNDNDCSKLARDITKQIESELEYPGQIKVTVCREMRVTEYAK
ncbi:MAG: Ribonuclease Y [candidate division BRC1 bacterium ADurb.BinA364]|nr:MAG: Ribonuclease Y [candidate division BRC1 bacterium ADurb.BinA364]